MPKTRIQIGLSGSRIPPEELAYYNSIKIPFREPQGHWEYFIVKPDSDEEWQALQKRLGPYVSFGKEWTRESKETKFMSEMSRIAAIIKELDQQSVEETTNVTDYNPSSQGGTRQELLAKYHKTRDPKDAEAARKAGATQQELQGMAEDTDQLEEGQIMDFLKKVGLATAVIGTLGLPGAIEMHFLHKTPLVQEIKRQAEQGNEQAKEDLDNLSVTLGSGRTGPTMVLLNRYGFKNVEEPESNDEREQYQETLARQLSKISDQLLG